MIESPRNNVCFMAPFYLEDKQGGAALIRGLFGNIPTGTEMCWLSFLSKSKKEVLKNIARIDGFFILRVLHSYRFSFLRRRMNGTITFFEMLLFIPIFYFKIRLSSPSSLIIYCHSHFFHLYIPLIRLLRLPFHLMIHDDPVVATMLNSSTGISSHKAREGFKWLIQNASSVDVISTRMQKKYIDEYGASSIVITNGWPFKDLSFDRRLGKDGVINIISTGNAWSTELDDLKEDNIRYFLDYLNTSKKKYRFKITTPWFPYTEDFSFVERIDYLSKCDFEKFMEKADIGYAYDPFIESTKEFCQLSFPSKIIGYLCRGVPFIYHGPKGSSVEDLLKEFNAGVLINSNDRVEMDQAIKYLLENYEELRKEAIRAWKEKFDIEKIREKFWSNYLIKIK